MVHGMSTIQNATENSTAETRNALTLDFNSLSRRVNNSDNTRVKPTAAAKSPLSGRHRTANPASNPLTLHHTIALRRSPASIALKADVTAKTIAAARKFVGTSLNTVAT